MSQWNTSAPPDSMVPRNCLGGGGTEVADDRSFLHNVPVAHISDSNPDGGVGSMCSELATILRRSAATLASTQDVVASGLRDGAFLSSKPSRLSATEMVLVIVTAAQGVVVVFVLLFVQPDEWGHRAVRLWRRVRREWNRLRRRQPAPSHQDAAPTEWGPTGRLCVLLALATGLFVYVMAPPWSDERSADGDTQSAGLAL